MIFGNLAVDSCAIYYEPIKNMQGLCVYVLKDGEQTVFVSNNHYKGVPEVRILYPKENPGLGITFGNPIYGQFIKEPEKFDFLVNPGKYEVTMMEMVK